MDYFAPETLEDTLKCLNTKGSTARLIAGGTDLIPRIRSGLAAPSLLIDPRLLSLDFIIVSDHMIRVGACTTHTQILESNLIAKYLPLLAESAREIAGPPVRNRGTIGGNLANASPAADLATPLLVYDAQVVLKCLASERVVPLDVFFTAPGKTILTAEEMMTEIRIPLLPESTGTKFLKLGKRKAMSISVVSVAARITLDGQGTISLARIALGSVAPTPVRATSAESGLANSRPNHQVFTQAGEIAASESSPISDIRGSASYRRAMVAVLTRRALSDAWVRAESDMAHE